MATRKTKKDIPSWLVDARKGGTTRQDPVRWALHHLASGLRVWGLGFRV